MQDEILSKLEKIDKNTVATLAAVSFKIEEANQAVSELTTKDEKRKEQLKEAQKCFKTIGFKAREEVYIAYEEYAMEEMGASSLSAFLREYAMFLFQNRDFQAVFKEFQILQKNDEKHHQVSFFAPKKEFDALNKMAEDEGFTIGQLTQGVMRELTNNQELLKNIVNKIRS